MEDNKIIEAEEVFETVEETTEAVPAVNEIPTVVGFVSGCKKLNIRKGPDIDAKVVSIVDVDTELTIINPDKATKGWYKVTVETAIGPVKGFCMKDFVTID